MPARKTSVVDEAEQVVADVPPVTNFTPANMPERANRLTKSEKFAPEKLGSITTYRWLDILDEAYKHGFVGFAQSNVHPFETLDRSGNKHTTWVASATGIFRDENGVETFHAAIGEANYENCNRQIGNSAARMAETRAKSRVLAHALNLDANVDFEMEDPTNPGASAIPNARSSTTTPKPSSNGSSFKARPADPSSYPEPNMGDKFVCEVCGDELRDTEKSTAGQKAAWSVGKNEGKILCWTHQQEAKSNS